MKTKDLIAKLKEVDPSGEIECCVGNHDISDLYKDPAYYDGALETIKRDVDTNQPISGKYHTSGSKIKIKFQSITDAIYDAADCDKIFTVDYSDLNEDRISRYKISADNTTNKHKEIKQELEETYFYRWLEDKARTINNDISGLFANSNFVKKHISYKDPIIGDAYKSYIDHRYQQWDKRFELTFDGLDWKLEVKNETADSI